MNTKAVEATIQQSKGEMAVDNRRDVKTKVSTTGPIVDWFADVVRSDLATTESVSGSTDGSGGLIAPLAPGPPKGLRGIARRLVRRYQRLPSWVLLLQVFLAFAWGRSGLAHALADDWWNGQQVTQFLTSETGLRVDAYQYVLTGIVEPMATATAVVIVICELLIATLLLLNYRASLALGLAAFMNVQLILAGQVSPSVFYLVAALGIAVWRFETTAQSRTLQRLSAASILVGIIAVAFLAPAIRTFRPEGVFEDPALVLVFLSILTVVALWWINRRVAIANQTLASLTKDGELAEVTESHPLPSLGWFAASLVVAAVILVGGLPVLSNDDGFDQELAAEATAAGPSQGSFDTPYPFGLSVTLNYNDLQFGESREWRVQVLESVLDDTSPIRSSPTTDGQLAMARVRLTYDRGTSAGPVEDIRFNAIGASGTVYPAKIEGCGSPAGRLDGDELTAGQAIEGWICWPVPNDELSSLVMGVEAQPADGVLYMTLQRAADS